ncbi:MAG: KAP family NTPase [Acidobacteria bacterium]|nr:KAP family NTPase [Acidobacteriota bacterium]
MQPRNSDAKPEAGATVEKGFDSPVGDPSGDLLDVDRHALALARYIERQADRLPFTIGIFGEWGEGKTTFVNFLCHHLAHPGGPGSPRQPINFISFSAWAYNTSDKLWRALILKIARVLYGKEEAGCEKPQAGGKAQTRATGEAAAWGAGEQEPDGVIAKVSRFLARDAVVLSKPAPDKFDLIMRELEEADYGQVSQRNADANEEATMAAIVKGAVAALSTFSPLVAGLHGLFGLNPKDEVAKALHQTNGVTRENVEALQRFQRIFGKIIRYRPYREGPVYIFIDDLDRAQPDVALDIIEAIRIALEDDNCVFILAVDHRLISEGLRLRYRELFKGRYASSFAAKGHEYLEKIIQFRMPMPPRTPEQVQSLIAAQYPEWAAAGDIIRTVVGANPRRIKQYCERLTFQQTVGPRPFSLGERRSSPAPEEEEAPPAPAEQEPPQQREEEPQMALKNTDFVRALERLSDNQVRNVAINVNENFDDLGSTPTARMTELVLRCRRAGKDRLHQLRDAIEQESPGLLAHVISTNSTSDEAP